MKKFSTFVGIDISKKTFDACIYGGTKSTSGLHQSFEQNSVGYVSFLTWLQD